MRASARLLPALTALGLTGTLLGGGVAAADLRADERRALEEQRRIAAAEAEARAVEDYRQKVAVLSEELFDLLQPLQSAVERVVRVEDASFTVLSDVTLNGGTAEGVKALRDRLAEVAPPQSLADGHDRFDGGLEAVLRGIDRLDAAVAPDLADEEFSGAFVDADDALDSGTRTWNARVSDVFAAGSAPSTAAESGPSRAARAPSSKAAYLESVGGLCAPTPADEPETPDGLRRTSATLRTLLTALREVPTPAPDADTLRTTVVEQLERADETAAGLEAAAGAIERRDERALTAADLQIERGLLAMQRASEGFGTYGSETCRLALQTEEDPESSEPLPT